MRMKDFLMDSHAAYELTSRKVVWYGDLGDNVPIIIVPKTRKDSTPVISSSNTMEEEKMDLS